MRSLGCTLPCVIGLVLFAGASGCRCGARSAPTAAATEPCDAPAPAAMPPGPSSRPMPAPPRSPELLAAKERALVKRIHALASGEDLAALFRDLPGIEKDLWGSSSDTLRGQVARSVGVLATCQAIRQGHDRPCERLASASPPDAEACRANTVLYRSALPAMAEKRPCDAAALTRAAAQFNVPAAEMIDVCNAVTARDPARCPGRDTALGVLCTALATLDPARCGTPKELEAIKGRSDCPPLVAAFKALAEKKGSPHGEHTATIFAAAAFPDAPATLCETAFVAFFDRVHVQESRPQPASRPKAGAASAPAR